MLKSINHKKRDIKRFSILPVIVGLDYSQEPVNRPKGFPSYQFFYSRKGEGELSIAGRKVQIREGQAMVLLPNEGHSYRAISPEWKMDMIAVSGKFCREIVRSMGIHESGSYVFVQPKNKIAYHDTIDNHQIICNYANRIIACTEEKELSKMAYSFLVDFLSSVKRIEYYEKAGGNYMVQEVIDYLAAHFADSISLDYIATEIGVTKEYLCSVFKKEMGTTIFSFLTNLRLGHARQYLVEYPERRIEEIATMCGYDNASYFGKVFRENVGMSPNKYRNFK